MIKLDEKYSKSITWIVLLVFLSFNNLSDSMAQELWKSDKYAYSVEIPSGYSIRKPTGKNIDLSLQSEDHAIASNINVVVRDISLETDDYDFSIWDTDLKSMFYEMEVGGRQYGLDIKVIDYGKTMVAGHEALWYHQVDGSIFTMVYDIKVIQYYYHLAYAMPIAAKERLMPVWYRFINQLKFMNK